jgi:general secretion pathway protein D
MMSPTKLLLAGMLAALMAAPTGRADAAQPKGSSAARDAKKVRPLRAQTPAAERVVRKMRKGGALLDAARKARGATRLTEEPVAPLDPAVAVPAPAEAPPIPPPPPPPVQPSTPTVTTTPAPTSSGLVDVPGEKEFNSCRKLPAGKRIVKLNLKPETEVSELISWISSITCTQFLIPSTTVLAGKKVTIISPQLITAGEAYRLFLATIEAVGLTVEPTDKFLRIVETNRVRFTGIPILGMDDEIPSDKRYVTRLIHLNYLDAADVTQNVLQRLKGEQGDIIAYQGSTLIVTDQAAMIRKMIQILNELDKPTGTDERMWMLRVNNTSVIEMANRLAEIFEVNYVGQGYRRSKTGAPAAPRPPAAAKAATPEGAGALSQPSLERDMKITKLIPVERTNHLIVVAKPRAYEWLRMMVAKLDVPLGDDGLDRVHIYYCEHANCDELAVTLGAVTGVPVAISAMGRPSRGGAAAAPVAPRPSAAPGQETSENQLFEGDVRINYDRPTNSLVIVSSMKDFQAMRKVIDRLDQPRKQVFIDAVVMEVLLDKSRDVGVAFHGGAPVGLKDSDDSLLLGGFRAKETLSPASLVAGDALNGLAGALFGPVLPSTSTRVFGTAVEIPSIGVLLQALQNNNDVNVLSNPYLIITNNEEGEISVGQNLPFPGAFQGGGFGGGAGAGGGLGGFLPSVSIQRQDVALKMKLVPSVNEHNLIRMEVEQEISDIVSPNFNGMGPATSKRSAKTTVVTRDQQTVLIGGLMSDRTSETVQKVPILGDIPILGFFFRHTKTNHQKTNIIIALTPHVIAEPSDHRRIVEKKMRERREFIERFTAFQDDFKFGSELDYSKKRGMLEQINRTVSEMEVEERSIMQMRDTELHQSTPIELPESGKAPAAEPKAATSGEHETGWVPQRRVAAVLESHLPDEPLDGDALTATP